MTVESIKKIEGEEPVDVSAAKKIFDAMSDDDKKLAATFDRLIVAQAPPENSRVFTITSDVADYLLEKYNSHNRPRKPKKIGEYKADMAKGHWALTGDTIKFSGHPFFRLRDGQNRLGACVLAKMAFKTHVVFGIPDESFDRMDQGKNRGGSDLLAIENIPYAGDTNAAVRWAELITTKSVPKRTTFPPPQILEMYKSKYSDVSDFIPTAKRIKKATGQPAGLVAAMLYAFDKVDSKQASAFATAWGDGAHMWTGSYKPLLFLQDEINTLSQNGTSRVRDDVRAALIVLAWNAYRGHLTKHRKSVKWGKEEAFPEIA